MSHIVFDYVSADDLPAALVLEAAGFTSEEAGTEASFRLRQSQAPHLFVGAYELQSNSRTLIGYVCATQSPEGSYTHASMDSHVPDSTSVCIHSVCVSPTYRGKGVGQALLKEYIARLEAARLEGTATWDRVILIAHDHLVPFYEKAGFENLGKSTVVHGSLSWFNVRRNLTAPLKTTSEVIPAGPGGTQQIPPGVLEALRRPRAAPSSKLISDFPDGPSALIQPSSSTGVSTNKFDLLCPRGDCGSIILKKGVGKWVERTSVQLEPTGHQTSLLPPLPTPPGTAQWWLITPSPMEFENIGFTRPVQPLTELGRKIKLLTCAECDLGPLGWSEEGGISRNKGLS